MKRKHQPLTAGWQQLTEFLCREAERLGYLDKSNTQNDAAGQLAPPTFVVANYPEPRQLTSVAKEN